jgi:penicillin amidase
MSNTLHIKGAGAPLEVYWDRIGIPHVFAQTTADAFVGMGYASGYQRLWQIHLSCLYANGCAASVLGRRFLVQDAVHRTFDVPAQRLGIPESDGDWIVDAYLEGLNAYVASLPEVPPEFAHAGTEPRPFTRADIASRYRFSSWFQHSSWVEKIYLAQLMTAHGPDYWRNHIRRFSKDDETLLDALKEPFLRLDPAVARLLVPDVPLSGSNNWAVRSSLSASGAPMLATDPHQPFSIPNTFFYVHLSAPGWDAFGASLPGMPYFMMGYNRDLAWGLTTGFIDNYDVYIERVRRNDTWQYLTPTGWNPVDVREERIDIKNGEAVRIPVHLTRHGPMLEPLVETLGIGTAREDEYRTVVRWTLGMNPTSAGTLSCLPLAKTAEEFGESLFENDVTPLVNNIICVDRHDDLRRWIVATLPKREGVTGILPFPGWEARYDFPQSKAADLLVEHNPDKGFALTANNDTMGDGGSFPIHNFPTHNARADRIAELLESAIRRGELLTPAVFESMQLDLVDVRARETVPEIIKSLSRSVDPDLAPARELLAKWDYSAGSDSAASCLYYPFMEKNWHLDFMEQALERENLDVSLIKALGKACPGLIRFRISDFLKGKSPWRKWTGLMDEVIAGHIKSTVSLLQEELGDVSHWTWGALHKIHFWHSLRKYTPWNKLVIGPDPIGGSATTLRMARHMGPGLDPLRDSGEPPFRVFHGPAFRLIVDLADPDHTKFVIAGGNGGSLDGEHMLDHYPAWLSGDYYTLTLNRDEIDVEERWHIEAQ